MKKHEITILPGWEQNRTHWQVFTKKFKDEEIKIIELPGFGEEKLLNDSWGIPEYSKWVSKQITNKDIILIGHSFGGRIAAYLASQNPNWLKKLILYGAPVLYRPSLKIRFKIRANKILKQFLPTKLIDNSKSSDLKRADNNNMGKIFRKVVPFDQTNFLPKIKAETLILHGTKDQEVNIKIAEETNRLIPNSKLIKLSNLGHNIHLTNPNIFYGKIKKFIK